MASNDEIFSFYIIHKPNKKEQLDALSELELRENALWESVEAAEKQYRTAELNYNAGYITRYSVDEALLAVKRLEAELEKNKRAQWL